MLRRRLTITAALGAAACAQLAGFEDLSVTPPSNAAGSAGAAMTAGDTSTSGGSNASAAGGTQSAEDSGGEGPGSSGSTSSSGSGAGGTTNAVAGTGSGGSGATAGTTSSSAGSGGAEEEVIVGCDEEQLVNGSFDAGASGWQVESSAVLGLDAPSDVILDKLNERLPAGVAPDSGDYLAWLGNRPNSQQGTRITLLQAVHIPDDVSHFTLKVAIRIRTAETAARLKSSRDQIDIALDMFDPNDERYWSFHYWPVSQGVATDKWESLTYDVDEPSWIQDLRGQRMRFKAESQSDDEGETTFWIDSLSFIAHCN